MQINIPPRVVNTYRNLVIADSSRGLKYPNEVRKVITGSIRRESALCTMLETAVFRNPLLYQIPFYDGDNCLGNFRLVFAKDNHRSGKCYVVKALLPGI